MDRWSQFRENKLEEIAAGASGGTDAVRDPHPFFEDVRKAAREETVELQRQLRGLAEGGQRSRAAGWARQAGLPALRRSGSSLSTEAARADFSKYLRTLEEALDRMGRLLRRARQKRADVRRRSASKIA